MKKEEKAIIMTHAGHHHHAHTHANQSSNKLWYVIGLTAFFMLVEFLGGMWFGSLALVADSGHMLSDSVALFLALIAMKMSQMPAITKNFSYGRHRAQILVAFANGISLFIMCGWIVVEALTRFTSHHPIDAFMVLWIATIGTLVNIAAFFILHRKGDSLVMRSAVLHVLWDLIGSVGTIFAMALILWTHQTWIDPALSLILSLLLLKSSYFLVKETSLILMEAVPMPFDVQYILEDLKKNVQNIRDIHHVHIWSLTESLPLMTMHVTIDRRDNQEEIICTLKKRLVEVHAVAHTTIQCEYDECFDDNCFV